MNLLTLSIIFIVTIGFIVVSTTRWHLHPFLALIFAAYGVGIATGVPLLKPGETIRPGFGNILGYIAISQVTEIPNLSIKPGKYSKA